MISALMTQHHPAAGPLSSRKPALIAHHGLACWTGLLWPDTRLPNYSLFSCPLLPVILVSLPAPPCTHTWVELCLQSIFLTALAKSLLPAAWPIVL